MTKLIGQRFFRPGGAWARTEKLNAYIDQNRSMYGALPICKVLQVAASAYQRHAARQPAIPGTCDFGMGRMIQPSTPALGHRLHPARRGWGKLLQSTHRGWQV